MCSDGCADVVFDFTGTPPFEFTWLIVQGGQPQELPADMLEAKVKTLVANNHDLPVFVAGDREANYEVVLDAMALLQNAGVEKVGLMSQPVGTATK